VLRMRKRKGKSWMSNDDILVGMKAIAGFLKVSRQVVYRWMDEYPEIPIRKDGMLFSNSSELSDWHRGFVAGRREAGH